MALQPPGSIRQRPRHLVTAAAGEHKRSSSWARLRAVSWSPRSWAGSTTRSSPGLRCGRRRPRWPWSIPVEMPLPGSVVALAPAQPTQTHQSGWRELASHPADYVQGGFQVASGETGLTAERPHLAAEDQDLGQGGPCHGCSRPPTAFCSRSSTLEGPWPKLDTNANNKSS